MKRQRNTSEILSLSQGKDLEALIYRVDEEWLELKEALLGEIFNGELDEKPSSQARITCLTEAEKSEAAEATEAPQSAPPLPEQEKFAITPTEANAILDRMDKLNQDSEMLERIENLSRTNVRLSVLGSIFCIFTFLFLVQLYGGGVMNLWQTVQGVIFHAPSQEVTSPLADHKPSKIQNTPATVSENVSKPASGETQSEVGAKKDQEPLPSTPTTLTATPNQGASASTLPPQAPEAPAFLYVGSITSNKYHYPDCKWAKTIHPAKVRGFTSVEEAQKAGYIQCPTCHPPLTDKPESPAAHQHGPGGS